MEPLGFKALVLTPGPHLPVNISLEFEEIAEKRKSRMQQMLKHFWPNHELCYNLDFGINVLKTVLIFTFLIFPKACFRVAKQIVNLLVLRQTHDWVFTLMSSWICNGKVKSELDFSMPKSAFHMCG